MKLLALVSFLPAAAALGYCNDKDLSCAAWGKQGECTGANSEVVKAKCPHTCGVCTLFCEDTKKECGGWRRDGECKNSPDFMSAQVPHELRALLAPVRRHPPGLQLVEA